MKFNILGNVLCLYFLCQAASGGRSSSSSSSSSSNGKSGKGQKPPKLSDIESRLTSLEEKLEFVCGVIADLTDRPGECPKVELLLPENCYSNPDAGCYADLSCKEHEKCCMNACGYKQCTEIKGCEVHDGTVPPGTTFFDGCNTCTCSGNGLLRCTKKGCRCPEGEPRQVQCFGKPCEKAKCDKYPGLACRNNYCGGCKAEFVLPWGDGGDVLDEKACDCGEQGPMLCEKDPCMIADRECPQILCIRPPCISLDICISNYCTCTAEWYWTDTGGVPYDESRDEGCSYRGP